MGLALAVALDRFGIRSLVVERSATTTDHPKSRGCWVRTMEIRDLLSAGGESVTTLTFESYERKSLDPSMFTPEGAKSVP